MPSSGVVLLYRLERVYCSPEGYEACTLPVMGMTEPRDRILVEMPHQSPTLTVNDDS